jgi:hypothetical protein
MLRRWSGTTGRCYRINLQTAGRPIDPSRKAHAGERRTNGSAGETSGFAPANAALKRKRPAFTPGVSVFTSSAHSFAAVFLFVAFTPSCCPFTTSFHARRAYNQLGVIGMFDVYVRGNSQLLVVRRGAPLPAGLVGGWRKKRAARAVSDEISGAVMREGFYKRSQARVMDAPADVSQSF